MNDLNAPIKWHRVADWIKRQEPFICCLQETHFEPKDTPRLKVKGWRSIFHAHGPQKKAGVVILISDKLDFKLKTVVRDTKGHYIVLKGTIHQDYLTIVYIYEVHLVQCVIQCSCSFINFLLGWSITESGMLRSPTINVFISIWLFID